MEQRSKIFLGLVLALVAVSPLLAGTGGAARLSGLNEVPALLTRGAGVLVLVMSDDRSEISYELRYSQVQALHRTARVGTLRSDSGMWVGRWRGRQRAGSK